MLNAIIWDYDSVRSFQCSFSLTLAHMTERTPRKLPEGDIINAVVYIVRPFPFHYAWVMKRKFSGLISPITIQHDFPFLLSGRSRIRISLRHRNSGKSLMCANGFINKFFVILRIYETTQNAKSFRRCFPLPCELRNRKEKHILNSHKNIMKFSNF
jgi:hypothetical protein